MDMSDAATQKRPLEDQQATAHTSKRLRLLDQEDEIVLGPEIPAPEERWSKAEEDALFNGFGGLLTRLDGTMTTTGADLRSCLAEICNPVLTPDKSRGPFWKKYRDGDKELVEFFRSWITYSPTPDHQPDVYIEQWDYLANTRIGLKVSSEDERFKKWFVRFLHLRGKYINCRQSCSTIQEWMDYKGPPEHPYHVNDFVVPEGGFKTFNQLFLRAVKNRPLRDFDVVAPCDGSVFYLTKEHTVDLKAKAKELDVRYDLGEKSGDKFNLIEALPGYGEAFVGGPVLDLLLWFSDYHHFHSPVDGTVINAGEFQGSYNYDFDNYNPNEPYAPPPPEGSERAGWYRNLCKHKRFAWIIKTERFGLVAMVAIGFWVVGSISSTVTKGQKLERGQYMGHFGYGGSSIVLAFEPQQNISFQVDGAEIRSADHPTLVKVKGSIGKTIT